MLLYVSQTQMWLQGYDDIDNIKMLLPIGNALRPSLYCDYYGGLCNRMTPVIVPLVIPRQNKEAATFSPTHAVDEIRAYMERAKRSNTPLFLTCLNTILQPLLSLDMLKQAAKHSFEGVSCVYSNVPGPVEAISLTPLTKEEAKGFSSNSYKINKMHVVMPHPVSIFQALSYNSSIFFNITLDTRAAPQPWILRTSFIEAVNCVADATDVANKWKNELECFEASKEWGGNGLVFKSCVGQMPENSPLLKPVMPKAA